MIFMRQTTILGLKECELQHFNNEQLAKLSEFYEKNKYYTRIELLHFDRKPAFHWHGYGKLTFLFLKPITIKVLTLEQKVT